MITSYLSVPPAYKPLEDKNCVISIIAYSLPSMVSWCHALHSVKPVQEP